MVCLLEWNLRPTHRVLSNLKPAQGVRPNMRSGLPSSYILRPKAPSPTLATYRAMRQHHLVLIARALAFVLFLLAAVHRTLQA